MVAHNIICVAGVEGLTDTGISSITALRQLTRLVVEAEECSSITLASLSTISKLTSLKILHWCSRDSMHGPFDIDAVTAQLCNLTGLRQLALICRAEELVSSGSAWEHVLRRHLPLCRLVLRRELVLEECWGDLPPCW